VDKEPTVKEAFETFRETSKQVLYDIRDCLNRPANELVSEQEKDPFPSQLVPEPLPTRPMSIQEHINFHKVNKVQTVIPEEQIVCHSDMFNNSIEMPFKSPLFHLNQFEKLEHEKPVEEVVNVHEVYKLDNDPQCLDEVIRNYLAIHTPSVELIESFCEDEYDSDELLIQQKLEDKFFKFCEKTSVKEQKILSLIWRKWSTLTKITRMSIWIMSLCFSMSSLLKSVIIMVRKYVLRILNLEFPLRKENSI